MNFVLDLQPFRAGCLVSLADTDAEFKRAVLKLPGGKDAHSTILQYDEQAGGAIKKGGARTYLMEGGESIIRCLGKETILDHGLIVHELFHAVTHVLRHRATPLTKSTEETYAYLLQMAYMEVMTKLS